MQIGSKVKLFIQKKPSQYGSDENIEEVEQSSDLNSAFLIGDAINKLAEKYDFIYASCGISPNPLHEMLHMFFGSMRFTNPDLYYQTVQMATQFPSFEFTAKFYGNRTMGDLCEEVFITEFAKYLTGQENDIPNLPKEVQHEIFYNTKRLLDTILMGDYSVKEINDREIYSYTLRDLSKFANSHFGKNSFKGSLDDAAISRIMANVKMNLVEKGELEEVCE